MVAGELSGDILGAGLIRALRECYPQARFEGIGGERMMAEGFDSLVPLETLSVMGLIEVVRHLPGLIRLRRHLVDRYRRSPPAVLIGIDAPDFNLGLERRVRVLGVPTVHYVSPSVWAWRQGRIRSIARSVDLMLTLLPFEAGFYQRHRVPVRFVGHPLADELAGPVDRQTARRQLNLIVDDRPVLAILPGSRTGEIDRLWPVFIDTAQWLVQRQSTLQLVVPAATRRLHQLITTLLQRRAPSLPVTVIEGQARQAMVAADAVLTACGTATLEALLLDRPMVVAYKVSPVTAWIVARLIRIRRFALPNLLAGDQVVPEFIQQAATADRIGPAVLALLSDPGQVTAQCRVFAGLRQQLRRNADRQAAKAVDALLSGRYPERDKGVTVDDNGTTDSRRR